MDFDVLQHVQDLRELSQDTSIFVRCRLLYCLCELLLQLCELVFDDTNNASQHRLGFATIWPSASLRHSLLDRFSNFLSEFESSDTVLQVLSLA